MLSSATKIADPYDDKPLALTITTIVSSKASTKTYAAVSCVFQDGDPLRHDLIRSEKNLAAVLASKASHVRRDTVQARQPGHKILRSMEITGLAEKKTDRIVCVLLQCIQGIKKIWNVQHRNHGDKSKYDSP